MAIELSGYWSWGIQTSIPPTTPYSNETKHIHTSFVEALAWGWWSRQLQPQHQGNFGMEGVQTVLLGEVAKRKAVQGLVASLTLESKPNAR